MSGAAGNAATQIDWRPDHRIAGRYRVQCPLGRGAGGAVLAVDDAGQSVVVRPLPASVVEDHRRLAALRKLALALAATHHPGLPRIREVGVDPASDVAFIVSDLVDGPSLYEVLAKRGPLEPRAALALIASASSAMASAHLAGVVHGDLKPEHIIIGRDGVARVIDFGLARDTTFTAHAKLARDGVVSGTPEFVAPEVARGEAPDARSDVYGLGGCLYEALVGEPPWTGDVDALLLARVSSLPPSPAAKVEGLDRRIDALVVRALAPDPRSRFGSMGDLEYQAMVLAAGARLPSVEGIELGSETRAPARAARATRPISSFAAAVRGWKSTAELPVPEQPQVLLLTPEELDAAARPTDDSGDVQDLDWLKLSMTPDQLRTYTNLRSSATALPEAPPLREPAGASKPATGSDPEQPISAITTVPVRERAPEVPGGPAVSVAEATASSSAAREREGRRAPASSPAPAAATQSAPAASTSAPSNRMLWAIAGALVVAAILALVLLR